ncbi:glycoside hydrolase family 26 protein [Galbitalea soli]|uniref:GH26 domain-containing protein n=1 Tax=Galbitalea soli TaxID=1268042 RepID=A0A7C9PM49_9MICO|nr:glycosyl hydrolase [Galbitalea soli]NEM90713.1 hypothetical protein [Galbitalea soli]NYJ31431.1 hypothetical protein [Galbitalea soli]
MPSAGRGAWIARAGRRLRRAPRVGAIPAAGLVVVAIAAAALLGGALIRGVPPPTGPAAPHPALARAPLGATARWGATFDPDAPLATAITEAESAVHRHIDIVGRFISWTWPTPVQKSVIDRLRAISSPTRTVMITWQPGEHAGVGPGTTPGTGLLQRIAAGREDAAAIGFLRQLADFRGPVVIRFAHEMNGSWYPWSGDPAHYVAAWSRIHGLVARFAPAARMAWSVNNVDQPAANRFERYWPGAAQVDMIGLDGYNCLAGWQSPAQVFARAYARLLALAPTTPLWITETASCESSPAVPGSADSSKAAWITGLLGSRELPRVTAVVWFDRDKEYDWRISSTPAAAAALRRALAVQP